MTQKEVLTAAHRYEDVTNLLRTLTAKMDPRDITLYEARKLYQERHGCLDKTPIDPRLLQQEAEDLLAALKSDTLNQHSVEDFLHLWTYVKDQAHTLLYNYAHSVSHRLTPFVDMEEARIWLILENLIICLDSDGRPWYIPDGWKRVDAQ